MRERPPISWPSTSPCRKATSGSSAPAGAPILRLTRRREHSTSPDDGCLMSTVVALTDAELVQRCRAGDLDAWNELVERFSRYVYAICTQGFRLSPADAEDVFQEVFTRVYTRLDSLRDDSALRPWIGQLTRRLCLDSIAASGRTQPAADVESDRPRAHARRGRGCVRRARGARRAVRALPGDARPLLLPRRELPHDLARTSICLRGRSPAASLAASASSEFSWRGRNDALPPV